MLTTKAPIAEGSYRDSAKNICLHTRTKRQVQGMGQQKCHFTCNKHCSSLTKTAETGTGPVSLLKKC
jgi:hypothetical protein